MKKNPLNDKDFLKALDLVKKKETYIKIHSLSFDEQIQETIEGKILSGSINIDGDSSVRRTCSLSMIAEDIDLNNYFWTINTKIKIFIGIENTINSNYDDIIWFKQGIFVLTNFNVTYNTNSYTINLSGQDKMCLLNGTIGGALFIAFMVLLIFVIVPGIVILIIKPWKKRDKKQEQLVATLFLYMQAYHRRHFCRNNY